MSLPNTSREFATKETPLLIVPLTHVHPVLREGILQAWLVKHVFETNDVHHTDHLFFFHIYFSFHFTKSERYAVWISA